jgi:hypothetical protein
VAPRGALRCLPASAVSVCQRLTPGRLFLTFARAVKRSWHEETVFKHQSRGEPAAKKRFVNDTIRSDFHRRFLNRYIK